MTVAEDADYIVVAETTAGMILHLLFGCSFIDRGKGFEYIYIYITAEVGASCKAESTLERSIVVKKLRV